jgi:hypothetical protein
MKKILIALVLAVVMSGNVYAKFETPETLKTNIDGVIIKNLVCYSYCQATLVNRNSEPLDNVIINLKLFDKDNDPIGSCKRRFSLDANSGMGIQISECNGRYAESVTVTATSNY